MSSKPGSKKGKTDPLSRSALISHTLERSRNSLKLLESLADMLMHSPPEPSEEKLRLDLEIVCCKLCVQLERLLPGSTGMSVVLYSQGLPSPKSYTSRS